ncbi:hypothetical protein HA402_005140 [Bradysia odoriphaga]|nr:hypothetical protein HA402_005140 [Bradysia odoriphaga]
MKIAALCIILSIPLVSSIIGGKDKDHKPNHMFVVSIQQHRKHVCCGVFVTLKFVLTASSCVKDMLADDISVKANITDLLEYETKRLDVKKIISKDPTGQKNVHNNIALLALYSGSAMIVERSQYIRTIRLPDERNIAEEGKPCIVYGWGTKSIAALCIILSIPLVSSIIGGKDKDHKENHMFVVSIQQHWEHFCCGVFITLKFVLTASSCVKDKLADDISVMANITDLLEYETTRLDVKKIISKDPTGQKNVHNNIALLALCSGSAMIVERSQYIRTIRLPDERNIAEEGKPCIVYGWGTKSIVSSKPSRILQVGSTELASLNTCQEYNSDVDESNLCANNSEATLCTFDIGDPLISGWGEILWGIATDEYACAGKSSDVFTRIDYHKNWILRTIDENSSTRHKQQATIMGTAIFVLWLMGRNL